MNFDSNVVVNRNNKYKNLKKKKIYLTADFETCIFRNKHILFLYSIVGPKGLIRYNYCVEKINADSANKLAVEFIKDLKEIKNNIFKNRIIFVYMHNFGNFDAIIFLDSLKKQAPDWFNSIKFTVRNNSFYEIKIFDSIILRDFYKLIPVSLNKMSLDLVGESKKDLDSKIFFSKKLVKQNILKIVDYCVHDSTLLYKSVTIINNLLVKDYDIHISDFLSVSALSYGIFKKHYDNDQIFNLLNTSANTYYDILKSYRGGVTDVYIPYGMNLNHYDVNSAYAWAMTQAMPGGKPEIIEDLKNFDLSDFFGFLIVELYVEKGEYMPMIGIKDSALLTNVYPTGYFTSYIFSEELKYAIRVNKIQIIKIYKAYKFEKCYPFNDFVSIIYEKKIKAKTETERLFYKSLPNYLYGRFGMKKSSELTIICSNSEYRILCCIFPVNIVSNFRGAKKKLISISLARGYSESELFGLGLSDKIIKFLLEKKKKMNFFHFNAFSAPQISSAIAAYSRILTDKAKRSLLKLGFKVFYTDTDSIITNGFLRTSSNLGGWKLEKKIFEGYFVAPKIYYTVDENGVSSCKFKGLPVNLRDKLLKNNRFGLFFDEFIKGRVKFNELSEDLTVVSPVKKDTKNMVVKLCRFAYKPKLVFEKRLKIFDPLTLRWIDTKPIHIPKKFKFYSLYFLFKFFFKKSKNWL